MKSVAFFLLGTLGFWVTVAVLASWIWTDSVWFLSGIACAICTIPAAATMIWVLSNNEVTADKQLVLVMGGTGIRMAVVIGVGMALFFGFPDYFPMAFWVWLLVFYIFTLAFEVVILIARLRVEVDKPQESE